MTWRDWMLTMGVGLCSSLLPACAGPLTGARPLPARMAASGESSHAVGALDATPGESAPYTVAAAPSSPYHALPPMSPMQQVKPEKQVEQVKYPASSVSRATLSPAQTPTDLDPGVPAVPTTQAPSAVELPATTPSPLQAEDPPGSAPLSSPEVKSAAEPALLTALRCFLENRPVEALTLLSHYDKANQELLLCLLPLAACLGEESLQKASPEEVSFIMDQLAGLQVALRPRTSLVIDKMCFCSQIKTFGAYDALPEDYRFHPGERALVYVELRDFSSEKRELAPGQVTYVTRLQSSAEILDYNKKKVWPQGSDRFMFRRDGPDVSRTLRHDYFDNCRFAVPDLPPGAYTLWIQVEDVPTKRTVKRSLDFSVTTNVGVRGSSGESGAIRLNSE
jgi:hypothetical protein